MKIKLMNDPVLRQPTSPVTSDELDHIKSLVPEMTLAMRRENGIGLAANQVGISKRFFIMQSPDGSIKLVINPEVVNSSGTIDGEEGCLSIPGASAKVRRAKTITISYLDDNWNSATETFNDLYAVVIQHEIDHLNGKLYIDSLPPGIRLLTIKDHKKFMNVRGKIK